MYYDRRQLEAKESHDTSKCIVTEAKGMRQGIVSQYNAQHAHDTTLAHGTAPTIRRWDACDTHDTARRGAGQGS